METDGDYTTYYDSDSEDQRAPTEQEVRNEKLKKLGITGSENEPPKIIRKIKNIFKILGD